MSHRRAGGGCTQTLNWSSHTPPTSSGGGIRGLHSQRSPPVQYSSSLPKQYLTTDASSLWGCGAWYDDQWFQIRWGQHLTIAEKEQISIVLAVATWGPRWRHTQVMCRCDNQTVVACSRAWSKLLIRCLVFLEAQFQFHLLPQYINTCNNHLADDLSRNNLSSFLSKVLEARKVPTPSPKNPPPADPTQGD